MACYLQHNKYIQILFEALQSFLWHQDSYLNAGFLLVEHQKKLFLETAHIQILLKLISELSNNIEGLKSINTKNLKNRH